MIYQIIQGSIENKPETYGFRGHIDCVINGE